MNCVFIVEVDVGMSANSIDEAVSAHVFEDLIDAGKQLPLNHQHTTSLSLAVGSYFFTSAYLFYEIPIP